LKAHLTFSDDSNKYFSVKYYSSTVLSAYIDVCANKNKYWTVVEQYKNIFVIFESIVIFPAPAGFMEGHPVFKTPAPVVPKIGCMKPSLM